MRLYVGIAKEKLSSFTSQITEKYSMMTLINLIMQGMLFILQGSQSHSLYT